MTQNTPRDLYTLEQVNNYLSRIDFPLDKWPGTTLTTASSEHGLELLTQLIKYQLCKVPFENLSLHYSANPFISIDKDDLYEKIVTRRRGGYCMELNHFFGTILKTLGYEVVPTGGRVCHQGLFGGL
jgi:arylamine N-acetyltransferase